MTTSSVNSVSDKHSEIAARPSGQTGVNEAVKLAVIFLVYLFCSWLFDILGLPAILSTVVLLLCSLPYFIRKESKGLTNSSDKTLKGYYVLLAALMIGGNLFLDNGYFGAFFPTAIDNHILLQMRTLHENPTKFYLLMLNLLLVVPIAEELFFRGCLLPHLVRNFGKTWAVFLCSTFFAALHWMSGGAISLFIFSLVACAVTISTRYIMFAIMLHACWNIISFRQSYESTGVSPWPYFATIASLAILPMIIQLINRHVLRHTER